MSWGHPELLPLGLLAIAIGAVLAVAWRARRRALERIAGPELLRSLVPERVTRARGWQAVLVVTAVALLSVAAAGPRLGFTWQQRRVEGVSLVVVLDVSRSMDAADVPPSRIERARRELFDLVGLLRGDAVGLVLHAAGAYVRIPLTVDYATFLWAVGDSSTGTIRAQGSSISGALEAAAGMLDRAPGTGRAILVVSDGEFHDEQERIDAALARVRAVDAHVYAMGIGEPDGAPIPLPEGGFKKDAGGEIVLSRLDEAGLRALAAGTGGAYVRAVASDEDVRALYEDEIRGKLEAAERGVRREKVWHERFQWPLAGALVALTLSAALGIGGRRAAGAGALLLALALPSRAWAGPLEEGAEALAARQWDDAARLLGQARVERPDDPRVGALLAEALYRSGRYREAEQLYRGLAEADPEHRATHLYNAAHAAYANGRLDEAARGFRDAAEAEGATEAAAKNAEAVEREIALRLQPPPPQERSPQQGGEQGGQGEGDADAQPGEPGDEDATAQGERSGEQPGDDGTMDAASPGEGTDTGAAAVGDATRTPDGPAADASSRPGAMSPEEAARMVDGVPDGTPRVAVGGRNTEKDW